jgi:DNA topoisomerase-1
MSADEPMAVVAPNLESGPITTASHVPEVEGESSDDDMPLAKGGGANGNKRAPATNGGGSSSEDEKPLVRRLGEFECRAD